MKRSAIVIAALALLVAACGESGSDETAQPEASATTDSPTTTAPPPTTAASPTTSSVPATIVPGDDPDVDAIVEAFTIAFDSTSDYAAKVPYLEDPSGLEETVAAYLDTGDMFGGIGVLVTSVSIDGDQAEVTYDILFNENPSYRDQVGTAVLTDAGWQLPRTVFCGLMKSARVGCSSQ